MIKILHIITDKNIGGAGHQVLALIDAMDASAFIAEVVVPEDSLITPLLAARGIAYHEAPHIADKSFSLAGVRALKVIIKRIRPDIVHTHSSLSGRIAAKLCRVGVVHTRHSVFPVAAWRKAFPIRQMSGFVNNVFSNRIIAVSPAAKENLLDLGTAEDKIRVVFNGTPPAQAFTLDETVALKQKYGIPPDAFVLAIMARLTEVKGHDDILDAAKIVASYCPSDNQGKIPPEATPEIMILVAGKGENQSRLEKRIANEGITNVKMLGFIEEVDEIVAVSDAQLNASYGTEASSMSLILGLSAGRPAIVSDYGGNPYLIQGDINGLVFETRNPLALAKAMSRLKSDPELYTKLSQGASRVYGEKFTNKKMAADTEAVYNEIMIYSETTSKRP